MKLWKTIGIIFGSLFVLMFLIGFIGVLFGGESMEYSSVEDVYHSSETSKIGKVLYPDETANYLNLSSEDFDANFSDVKEIFQNSCESEIDGLNVSLFIAPSGVVLIDLDNLKILCDLPKQEEKQTAQAISSGAIPRDMLYLLTPQTMTDEYFSIKLNSITMNLVDMNSYYIMKKSFTTGERESIVSYSSKINSASYDERQEIAKELYEKHGEKAIHKLQMSFDLDIEDYSKTSNVRMFMLGFDREAQMHDYLDPYILDSEAKNVYHGVKEIGGSGVIWFNLEDDGAEDDKRIKEIDYPVWIVYSFVPLTPSSYEDFSSKLSEHQDKNTQGIYVFKVDFGELDKSLKVRG